MVQNASGKVRAGLQVASAVLGAGLFGVGLNFFGAPLPLWFGSGLCLFYLLQVGRGGIFLVSIWVTLLMTIAIAQDVMPSFWPGDWHYRYWAQSLMLIWAIAIGLIYWLGYTGDSLRSTLAVAPHRLRLVHLSSVVLGLSAAAFWYIA